jgi:hypothetical protein
MTSASAAKWSKAEAELPADLRPVLKVLKEDYEKASRIHEPQWTGGPNAKYSQNLFA